MGSDIASRGKTLVLYARARAGYGLTGFLGLKKCVVLGYNLAIWTQYPDIHVVRGFTRYSHVCTAVHRPVAAPEIPVIHYDTLHLRALYYILGT